MSSRLRRANRKVALFIAAFNQHYHDRREPQSSHHRNVLRDMATRLDVLADSRDRLRGSAAFQTYLKRKGIIIGKPEGIK